DARVPGDLEGQEPQGPKNSEFSLGLAPWPVLWWKDHHSRTRAEVLCGPGGLRLSCTAPFAEATWHVVVDRGACSVCVGAAGRAAACVAPGVNGRFPAACSAPPPLGGGGRGVALCLTSGTSR